MAEPVFKPSTGCWLTAKLCFKPTFLVASKHLTESLVSGRLECMTGLTVGIQQPEGKGGDGSS